VAASSLAIAWPLGLRGLDVGSTWAVLFGAVLALVNTIAAHFIVLWSEHRSTNVFLGTILGGMVGRMAVLLVAVVTGIVALDLPRVPLAVSLLFYFVLFLVMEITILHRRTPAHPGAGR
jgi:hypothetical protein